MKKTLSVVEGKWFRHTHVSIRDILSPLFEIWGGGSGDYHYEMFSTADSLRIAIDYAFQGNQADTVYLATHGTATSLEAYHDGHSISRAELAHSIDGAGGKTKRGLHIGSCLFGSYDNASWLLDKCQRISWIAGYSSSVDWIDSSALDLFWLRHLLYATPGKGKAKPTTPMEHLEYAVERTRKLMLGLAQDLEFHVFSRKRGPGGGIEDLIQ